MTTSIIIDTDAGTDDFMAIAWLLSQPAVRVEAITVVHGLAHVGPGARNLRRLLRIANREDIPVIEGEDKALNGSREFPAVWRTMTDELPGVRLPVSNAASPAIGAVEFLKIRLRRKDDPVRILALGPLTNLALALRDASDAPSVRDVVIMGGAVQVPGNLMDGNADEAVDDVAEWNIYCDPEAAAECLNSSVPKLLVGLDATNLVPIDRAFVDTFDRQELTPLGRLVGDVLVAARPLIEAGHFFAWDPLAAMALLDPSIVESKGAGLQVVTAGKNTGQTKLLNWDGASSLRVATGANAARFMSSFNSAFREFQGRAP